MNLSIVKHCCVELPDWLEVVCSYLKEPFLRSQGWMDGGMMDEGMMDG